MLFLSLLIVCGLVGSAAYTRYRSSDVADRFPPIGSFVEARGARLHYLELGRERGGPTVVLVHGASSNLLDMRLALGERLAERYRVILFDRPGFGWSDEPTGTDATSPRAQADRIHEALDRLKVGHRIMVGHSWAGALVLAYALDHPEALDGVVALAPVSHPWPGGISWYYSLTATPVAGLLFAGTVMVPMAETLIAAAADGVFGPQAPPRDYVRKAGIPLILRPHSFRRNARDVAALYDFVVAQSRHYGEIAVPVTIVAGADDTTVLPSIHSEALKREVPDVRLVMLDGVGHMPHYARPDLVIAEIDRLADRAAARSPHYRDETGQVR
jgi:pimeloyl-ACP methyl ester carboxylesterase